jgi:hypothetical protein
MSTIPTFEPAHKRPYNWQMNALVQWMDQRFTAIEEAISKKPVPSDLAINISPKEKEMPKIIAKLCPKGSKGAVMPPVNLLPGENVTLQVIDQNGQPFPVTDPTTVATTVTSSDPTKLAVAVGADGLHYKLTIQPNQTGQVALNSTLAFNTAGSPGPFTASVQCTLPTPPAPVATDLNLIIS